MSCVNPLIPIVVIVVYINLCLNQIYLIIITVMSLDTIIDKLLISLKTELDRDKNKEFIEDELLKPLIHKILDQMYPYILWPALLFMSMFIFIMIILFLNIRVFMCTQ